LRLTEEHRVVVPGLGLVNGRWCLLEEPQRLLDERQAVVGGVRSAEERYPECPDAPGALVNNRGRGWVGVAGIQAVRLVGEYASLLAVARYKQIVDGSQVPARQIFSGGVLPRGRRQGVPQFDGPVPMFSRLGVAEDPLGGLGRFYPGSQLLGLASGSGPVPGRLGGEGRLAGRL
jgi:hypothetical protein